MKVVQKVLSPSQKEAPQLTIVVGVATHNPF